MKGVRGQAGRLRRRLCSWSVEVEREIELDVCFFAVIV